MQRTSLGSKTRSLVMAPAVAALAFGTAAPTAAGGLVNCVDVTGKNLGRVGCYENVWSGGSQYRMTFPNQSFDGATPGALARFYVLARRAPRPRGPSRPSRMTTSFPTCPRALTTTASTWPGSSCSAASRV